MRSTIGIHHTPKSNDWQTVIKGPCLGAVRAHVERLSSFPKARIR